MKDAAPHPGTPQTALRRAETVMRLGRMGAAFPTRLCVLRMLTRQLSA